MCATTLGTTLWATSMSSFEGKRMQSGQWLNSTTAGSMGRLYMLSCPRSLTSGSHVVGSMRWAYPLHPGNVPEVVSAISCTCDPFLGTSGGNSTVRHLGAGHPRGPILATDPEKGISVVHQTTDTAASEPPVLLPYTPDRHRSSWPGPFLSAFSASQRHRP